MRVLFTIAGSRGDVQPAVALAYALRTRGHEAVIAAPANFGAWVQACGFSFVAAGPDVEAVLRAEGFTPGSALRFFRACVGAQARLWDVAKGCDVVVGTGISLGGPTVAEAAGIPYVYGALAPHWFRSRAHGPITTPPQSPRWLNGAWWALADWSWKLMWGAILHRERAALGLPPVEKLVSHQLGERPLLAFDESLAPLPEDIHMEVVRTGAWFVPDAAELDPDLEAFLRSGPPPIYLGFGSMPDAKPAATTARVVAAIERLGVRAVLSSGWAGLGAGRLPPSIHVIGSTNHSRLFPRCALVIHHGGAGTTAAAARSGIPQLVVPHAFDQYFWAATTRTVGIAALTLPRPRLTAERLAMAIQHSLEAPDLRERARVFAQHLHPDGAGVAVQHLEDRVGERRGNRQTSVPPQAIASLKRARAELT